MTVSKRAQWAFGLLLALSLFGLFWVLRAVITPVFFAFLIAYMLDPVVDRLEEWRLPRAAGILVIMVVVSSLIGGFLLVLLPGIFRDIAEFFAEVPGALAELLTAWEPVLESYGLPAPHSLSDVFEQVSMDADGLAQQAVGPTSAVLSWVVGGTASVLSSVVALSMIPVFAFYLLYDFDRITAAITKLVPWSHRAQFLKLSGEVDSVLGQFIRGQILVMLTLAVLYAIGFSIAGVRLAIPIGIIAGLLAFIPYVGGATALVLALGMCLFDWQGWDPLIGVLVVYAVVQALDGLWITPGIVGDKVGLSALWVLLALMAFGEVFGFLGVLLAVPAAAVLKIFVVRSLDVYTQSDLYLEGAPDTLGLTLAEGRLSTVDEPPSIEQPESVPESDGESERLADLETEPLADLEELGPPPNLPEDDQE